MLGRRCNGHLTTVTEVRAVSSFYPGRRFTSRVFGLSKLILGPTRRLSHVQTQAMSKKWVNLLDAGRSKGSQGRVSVPANPGDVNARGEASRADQDHDTVQLPCSVSDEAAHPADEYV